MYIYMLKGLTISYTEGSNCLGILDQPYSTNAATTTCTVPVQVPVSLESKSDKAKYKGTIKRYTQSVVCQ